MLRDILRRLSDGNFHSGVDLAQAYALSKTTIHNKIKDIAALGVEVSALRGRGYRIYEGLDLLDADQIAHSLLHTQTHITLKSASTNDECRQLLANNANQPVVCSSELQTAGRGRRGKTWSSPFAKHIYLSVGFTLSLPLAHVSGITLATGVVVARLLDELGVASVGVKWPNDIWINGSKVAGILTEVVGDAQGPCSVVIGLGVNVYPTQMKLDKHQKIAYLKEGDVKQSRTELVIKLASTILTMRDHYEKHGLSAYMADWDRYDILRSKPVTVSLHDQQLAANCLGITKEGLLKIDVSPYELSSGEVSVRPK